MSARRIARELAVILLPQLPKDKDKLTKLDFNQLITRAVHMLSEHAKQNLADADAALMKASQQLVDIEIEHPKNAQSVDWLEPVQLTTGQLKEQLELLERAIHLVAEALDIPESVQEAGGRSVKVVCKKCHQINEELLEKTNHTEVQEFVYRLITTYLDHHHEINELLAKTKANWKIDRMISIDRDILRLACTEAFYMDDIPVPVCINEAVLLSHRFADEKAAKFINGVLGDLVEEAKSFRRTGKFAEADVQPH